jgi:hypothetical protein
MIRFRSSATLGLVYTSRPVPVDQPPACVRRVRPQPTPALPGGHASSSSPPPASWSLSPTSVILRAKMKRAPVLPSSPDEILPRPSCTSSGRAGWTRGQVERARPKLTTAGLFRQRLLERERCSSRGRRRLARAAPDESAAGGRRRAAGLVVARGPTMHARQRAVRVASARALID